MRSRDRITAGAVMTPHAEKILRRGLAGVTKSVTMSPLVFWADGPPTEDKPMMTKRKQPKRADYRLRIVNPDAISAGDAVTYIVRLKGAVEYMSGDESPLMLSSLVESQALELRFALEDAADGVAAAAAVQIVLDRMWASRSRKAPCVEVLA